MKPVAVITGGASGIGLATARRLRATYARVALLDIDPARGRRAAEELGDGAAAFECNVVDEASLAAVAGRVEAELGPIEALVCGAGAPQVPGPVDAMAIDEWETVVDSHLKGTFLTCRIFGRHMVERGHGAIVNIASVTGYAPGPTYAYAPSKAAIITLTTILAVEWARKGVRVNAVARAGPIRRFSRARARPARRAT
jgi:NAD(P)-dependent dehydrogenase (short-subunit alcohol dehydrogenase family)